ncbi:MAG: M48 family metallopeptidase [Spirochaetota bacterium]
MTDILFYDGISPVPKNGKMIPYTDNIQIETQSESGARETVYVKYSEITEISKTGDKSDIKFAGTDENCANRLIVFSDLKTYEIIYRNWSSNKQNFFYAAFVKLSGLSNFKKAALALIAAPVAILIIMQILNRTYIFFPLSVDRELGSRAGEIFLKDAAVVKNRKAQHFIEDLTKKIAPKDTVNNYKIFIIKNPEINAFSLTDGSLLIYTGLIDRTETPEELAGVLAHEISHVEMRHGLRQLIRVLGISYLISSVVGAGIEGLEIPETISEIANIAIYNKYSREFEKEADLNSVKLLQNACISPDGIMKFFERLNKNKNMPAVLSWFNSHPSFDSRIKYLTDEIKHTKTSQSKKQFLMSKNEWEALKVSLNREGK